ncbi:MAG: Tol-Pal system beta propeller repeat protein TolB [Candidatus Aminicenantes bacterium]|nr:Tol-Pal system beta propeller repeat protein TolB [Candidatus Aminicenantes bacterium]
MRKILLFFAAVSLFLIASVLLSQQEVYITLKEGVPAISIALPDFIASPATAEAREAAIEIYGIISADLAYSRIFQIVPKKYHDYIRPLDPKNILFKDWESIQAGILLVGEIMEGKNDGVVFEGNLYDVKAARHIFGKRYQAAKDLYRLAGHRMADEIVRVLSGERPIFTSKIVFVSDRDGNDELYMMDYDGHNQTRLTFNKFRDYIPARSPDGKKIAYTSYTGVDVAGLYLLDLEAGKKTPVTTRGTSFSPDFSPDGKKLAFCSTMDGNAEIYVALADGKNIKRLTYNQAIDTAPSWSPTGREIAFVSDRSGTPQIYIMDAEGSNVRRVSFGGTYHDSPAWAPTGDRIVYVSRVENIFDLYVLNLRSNQIIKLTESNARNESPAWSPDGRHIVFSSNMSGPIQLYTIDYDGANLRRLTSQGANKLPHWSN